MADTTEERERSCSRSPVRRSRSQSPKKDKPDPPRPFMGGRRVVVRNIPYEVRWQELKDMFRKDIGDVTYVEMLETPDGKSKGVAVVEFRDPEHAKKAIDEYHQKKIKDRAIIVREEREKDRQEFQQHKNMKERGLLGPGGGVIGGIGMGVPGLPPGINPHILQQLGIEPPITNTVFVANLDYKVTWWKLKDVFKLAGNVIKAEIKEDKSGMSRGMGIVTFEHPVEAVQAVSMFNGHTFYERNMIVRIDKGIEIDKPKLPSGLKSIGMGLGTGGAPLTNIGQLSNNLGLCGGSGLLGMGNLGGGGLGLLGSGDHRGMGMGGGLGGMGLGGPDIGLGGSSKLGGLSDPFSNNYSGLVGSTYNGSGSLSGLGGLGPSLNSLGLGGLGGGDRLGFGDGLGRVGLMSGINRGRDDDNRRTTRPDNCTITVKNLPYSVTWQALKEHFKDTGDVKFAEIVVDKGRSTGIGYVRFGNEADAQRAINLKNRSRMEHRNIDVSLHRV